MAKLITFKDFHQYILSADVDSDGWHFPFEDHRYGFLIDNVTDAKLIANLYGPEGLKAVFIVEDDDTVRLCRAIDNCTPDYGSTPYVLPTKTPINGVSIIDGWPSYFGDLAGTIKVLLVDMLSSYMIDNELARRKESQDAYHRGHVYSLISRMQAIGEAINCIRGSYLRCNGPILTINIETEDHIQSMCQDILNIVEDLENHDYTSSLHDSEADDIIDLVNHLKQISEYNLKDVHRAKNFYNRYCSGTTDSDEEKA